MKGTTAKVMATMAASGWSALLSIVATPLYVHFIGVEAFGLLGLYASLQVVLSLLDLGIGATQTRELARMGSDPESRAAVQRLSRTHEVIYAALAAVAMIVLALGAPLVATHWVKSGALSASDIAHSLRIGTLALGTQWLTNFYGASLAGLHRQTLLAAVSIPAVTLRTLAPLLSLWLVAPTLDVLFATHAIVGIGHALVMRGIFWHLLPRSENAARFDWQALAKTARFSAGMTAVTLTAVMLIQADKLLVSKLVTLEQFGYYMLASALATGINQIVGPIFGTMYPRLSQLVAGNDVNALSDTFHSTAQFLAVTVLPVATMLAFFSDDALFAWTGNQAITDRGASILSLLAVAWGLNGLMSALYMLEIAEGRTAPAVWSHCLLLALTLPLTYAAVLRYGPLGGAIGWCASNIVMLLVRPWVSLCRLTGGDRRAWWIEDVARPMISVCVIAGMIKFAFGLPANRFAMAAELGLIWTLLSVAAVAASPRVASNVKQLVGRAKGWASASRPH